MSRGEPKEVWDERIKLLKPYQVNREALDKTGNKNASSCACRPSTTPTPGRPGHRSIYGRDQRARVTDDVFESDANIAFDQAENRLHTIKGDHGRNDRRLY